MQYHQGFRVDDMPLRRILVHLETFAKHHNEAVRLQAALAGAKLK
jgi:hypothetical protein